MIIKVCGMREAENIKDVDNIDAVNWMGFIFFPKSKRHVESLPSYMPRNSKRVGVFVNAEKDDILTKCHEYSFDIIQLHGNEDADYCQSLRHLLDKSIKIIKMIQVSDNTDIRSVSMYEDVVDYFLFETKCQSYGGSGTQFDWNILEQYEGSRPFLITGGITPDDAEKVKAFHHPMFAGIDLNSKFETSPAFKNVEAIKAFVANF